MDMEQFQARLKGKTVMVDFGAAWCGPCRAMEPIIKEITPKYEGKAQIIEINIDDQKQLATEFMVQSIPTLILFKDGREVKRLVGLQSRSSIEKHLNKILTTP